MQEDLGYPPHKMVWALATLSLILIVIFYIILDRRYKKELIKLKENYNENGEQPRGAEQPEPIEQPGIIEQPEPIEQPSVIEQPRGTDEPDSTSGVRKKVNRSTSRKRTSKGHDKPKARRVLSSTSDITADEYERYFKNSSGKEVAEL